ncbi:cyclic nucleotide-gated ion channel 1-like [Dorcoceras hygrometricum]|uniref:Cyclic nucleotide-gated ion channel 1-like n=1 Tax=Dorcoceras hygrometricum TaxID=472368 RepID=A0A2Z7C801_9LAMI|nr:cyclic nucleotide-gated ion channel 1-like [Dorcoceras hygrometricum]
MPPRRIGRDARQVVWESRAPESGEDVAQPSVPVRRRARQTKVEVEHLTRQVDEMEMVMARFHGMNPLCFLERMAVWWTRDSWSTWKDYSTKCIVMRRGD